MPQKRNPYPFSIIRSRAGSIFSRTAQAFGTLDSPVLGTASPLFLHAEADGALSQLSGALALADGFLPTIKINKAIMKERATMYWAQGTDLTDAIVRHTDLSFRTAHHIVAQLVQDSSENGKTPSDVNTEMIDRAAKRIIGKPIQLSPEIIRTAMDPAEAIRARRVYGATSPEEVSDQITEGWEVLVADKDEINSRQQKLHDAEQLLSREIQKTIRKSKITD